jgi:hypothetical protein
MHYFRKCWLKCLSCNLEQVDLVKWTGGDSIDTYSSCENLWGFWPKTRVKLLWKFQQAYDVETFMHVSFYEDVDLVIYMNFFDVKHLS